MLAIRLQRTGRKGHAQFRIIAQDSHASPKSGKVIAVLGSYNPHTKVAQIDKETAKTFLKNGAQPSDRIIKLFKTEKISLPKWVSAPLKKKRSVRNPDKLRKNRPAEKAAPTTEKPAKEASKHEEQQVEEPQPEQTQTAEEVVEKTNQEPDENKDEKKEVVSKTKKTEDGGKVDAKKKTK